MIFRNAGINCILPGVSPHPCCDVSGPFLEAGDSGLGDLLVGPFIQWPPPIRPEALRCKESGEAKTLFFNLTGHGHFDMAAYDKYFAGPGLLSAMAYRMAHAGGALR